MRCCTDAESGEGAPARSESPAAADTPGRTCRCRAAAAGPPVGDGIRNCPSRLMFRMLSATGWMSAGVSCRKVEARRIGKELGDEPACCSAGNARSAFMKFCAKRGSSCSAGANPLVRDGGDRRRRCARRSGRSAARRRRWHWWHSRTGIPAAAPPRRRCVRPRSAGPPSVTVVSLRRNSGLATPARFRKNSFELSRSCWK